MDREETKRKKGERRRERCPGGQRTRVNLGGKRMAPETSRTGININLNIGTESRVQIADALGKEIHHPKMSKLWYSKTGPTDRQTIFIGSIILIGRYTFTTLKSVVY